MEKELKDKKESTDLRLKTLVKQEDNLMKKLNTIRAKVEGSEKADAEVKEEKNEKKKEVTFS